VFVPLAAVLLADYFVRCRGRYGEAALFARSGVRWRAFVPWVLGFVVYQWSVPTGPDGWVDALGDVFGAIGLPFPLFDSRLGASIPSFVVAFGLAALLSRSPTRRPRA
jgi:purine-cytosine permease-like protein